jgi:hypothetical protein
MAVALALGASYTTATHAQEPTERCVAAFEAAQELRAEARLLEAQARLAECGHSGCPDAIRVKCVEWSEQVRADTPTLVIAARDAEGQDVVNGDVTLDGQLVIGALDGKPIATDPGRHTLRVTHRGSDADLSFVARTGQKNRVLRVDLRPIPDPIPPPRPQPVAAYAAFGVAGVTTVIATVTGIVAIVRADELEAQCQGGVCHPGQKAELESGEAIAHVSTVHFALAGATLASGVIVWLLHDAGHTGVESARLDLAPGRLVLRGRF